MVVAEHDRAGDHIILAVVGFTAVLYALDQLAYEPTVVMLLLSLVLTTINLPYRIDSMNTTTKDNK